MNGSSHTGTGVETERDTAANERAPTNNAQAQPTTREGREQRAREVLARSLANMIGLSIRGRCASESSIV